MNAASRQAGRAERDAGLPSRRRKVANFVLFQAAWFAAVLGAARQVPLWGTACVVAVIGWHVAISARPAAEARLVALACCIGFAFESAMAVQGLVRYPSGQPAAALAPYWLVALWGLLAISPNVTLRWLKGRPVLAAAIGAVAGPAAFASGARLGAANFTDSARALVAIGVSWAVLLPALMWLSERYDGVVVPRPGKAPHG